MAIYRFEAKVITRNGGRSTVASAAYRSGHSATAAAAYRSGGKLKDERSGQSFDFSKKRGVMGAEIMLPEGAPAWMRDRQQLWNSVERIEKRIDSQLARDFILSLPHEMTHAQRVELTRAFVREQFTARGYAADIAWHSPDRNGGLNHHAHVMVPFRKIDGEGFARLKERTPPGMHPGKVWKEELLRLREAFADTANLHLEAAGLDVRIDHRSLVTRGIDREPEPKQGPLATHVIEAEGRRSRAGDDRREVQARNAQRAALKGEMSAATAQEAQIIDLLEHRQRRGQMQHDRSLNEEAMQQRPDREAHRLQKLRQQEERAKAFREAKELEAEDAKRRKAALAQEEERTAREGGISRASSRYAQALGAEYDIRDPYGSLARAAMAEYGMFHKEQERLRAEIAREQDPEKRRLIELKKQIEANDYMAITSERLAGISAAIAGRENAPQAVRDRESAVAYRMRGADLRDERSELMEARERSERTVVAEQLHELGKSVGSGNVREADDAKRARGSERVEQRQARETTAEQQRTAERGRSDADTKQTRESEERIDKQQAGGREGGSEMTDRKQAQGSAVRAKSWRDMQPDGGMDKDPDKSRDRGGGGGRSR